VTSRLSKSIPDVGQLQTLFQSEAASLLLFLKSVEELEWSVWTDRVAADGGDEVKVDVSASSPMPIFNIKLEFGVVTSLSSSAAPAVKTIDAKQQAITRTNRLGHCCGWVGECAETRSDLCLVITGILFGISGVMCLCVAMPQEFHGHNHRGHQTQKRREHGGHVSFFVSASRWS
jgi:hypothetical protein